MTVHLILTQRSGRQLKNTITRDTAAWDANSRIYTKRYAQRQQNWTRIDQRRRRWWWVVERDDQVNNKWELIFMYLFGDEQRYRGTISFDEKEMQY